MTINNNDANNAIFISRSLPVTKNIDTMSSHNATVRVSSGLAAESSKEAGRSDGVYQPQVRPPEIDSIGTTWAAAAAAVLVQRLREDEDDGDKC